MVDGNLTLGDKTMILTIAQEASKLPPPLLTHVTQAISAMGALGTAAFGLVDATKAFGGGVNHAGFGLIKKRVCGMMAPSKPGKNSVTLEDALLTLKANWFNGTELGKQKAIAKSLIKLYLDTNNAEALAKATQVNPSDLKAIATSMASSTPLTTAQSDVYARFDLILTALLDETYQRADARYTNSTRLLAMVFALGLALTGSWILDQANFQANLAAAFIVGILATPLAPIAKDLSTALATAVNAMQAARK